MESSLLKIAEKYRVITYQPEIGTDEAGAQGDPIIGEGGSLIGFKLEEQFNVVKLKIWPTKTGPNRMVIYRNCLAIRYMNPWITFDTLLGYMTEVLRYCTTNDLYEVDRVEVSEIVDHSFDADIDYNKIAERATYYWIGLVPLEEKRRIIINNVNETRVIKSVRKIENFIEAEVETGSRFITVKMIVDGTGLNRNTVFSHIKGFREKINNHNYSVFQTTHFKTYEKTLNIHKIKKSIKVLSKLGDKISKANVSRDTGLHYNSILNLWQDEEVQEELDKYNQVIEETP